MKFYASVFERSKVLNVSRAQGRVTLTADGGSPGRCGWLKDKFGVSWQIIPNALGPMLADSDPARAKRTLDAMLQMDRLDLARLEAAHGGD